MITFINDTLIRLIEVTMASRYLNNLIDLPNNHMASEARIL